MPNSKQSTLLWHSVLWRPVLWRIVRSSGVALLLVACAIAPTVAPTVAPTAPSPLPSPTTNGLSGRAKPVAFAILEDYDKGQDLAEIALDFQLMKELEIDELRTSFGWDDYEPAPGHYDFAWLERFVTLAAGYDIQLRPYIAYTPSWAGGGGADAVAWNDPPASQEAWMRFVYHLALALRDYPNVLSYEIYNEENDPFWWDGTVEQYIATLTAGAQAIRRADPDAQVLLGGLVFPDDDWLLALLDVGAAVAYDVTPFHAYPETWSDPATVVENYLDVQYQDYFVPHNNTLGEGEPLWINEMGYATTPGRSEEEQANWFARAVSAFLADPEIEYLGLYEIKDLSPTQEAIGDHANYHLGITRADRTKKLAFYTVDLLTDLLDTGALTPADEAATVAVTEGAAGALYHHLFLRPDGQQVLFVYDKLASPTVKVTLAIPGRTATRYALNGSAAPFDRFDGVTLEGINLRAGEVAIFRIRQ